ncbi:ribonuclease Y [Frankia sp. AgB32]|uniref:ribonuclease Y n=1 Tax=Frankia sp. AgB32 TaxID=631119 RepID=UPI00200E2A95|nr:ribonuclease Y [Frankia sp. AgB32]MCK9895717.1 ribonuclease Y [Frankia sp. AgB32]
MEGVLVILLSLVLVVLVGMVAAVGWLMRSEGRPSAQFHGAATRRRARSLVPLAPSEADDLLRDDSALDDGEPMVRVLPPAPAGETTTADGDEPGVVQPAAPIPREKTPAAERAVAAERAGGELRAESRRSVLAAEAEAAQVLIRVEREVRERLARAEREAAEIRRRGAEEATSLRERAQAQVAKEAARAESAAREAARSELAAARAEIAEARSAFERDARVSRTELQGRQAALDTREQQAAERVADLDKQAHRLARREQDLRDQAAEVERRTAEVADAEAARRQALEQVAGLTATAARAELVSTMEQDARREAALLVREIETQAQEEGEERARRIVTTAIQRIASEQTTESVVTVVHLPGDEMKGRIIGREGRNIRAFESVTGVNVLIDDTPEAVLLSCFDPVRREIGRITLAALVSDGRIHPHRIEEEYARAQVEVEQLCVRAGEDALLETGVDEMHPELVTLLGRLRYRTSYGQNVLAHLIESAHLAGIMAAELRMALPLAKRAALLHDLGKALTHEVPGSHAIIGADMARRYGENEEVVHAIEAHHNEVAPRSLCAVLTQAADQISGGRPGARRDSLESYVKRLERIEQIAGDRPGVDRVFAMQAGREVRVMVVPEEVDDAAAHLLARDVARQIEDELTYPGQIRVTVVRETRAVGTAR